MAIVDLLVEDYGSVLPTTHQEDFPLLLLFISLTFDLILNSCYSVYAAVTMNGL